MRKNARISVIIPAINEAKSIASVLNDIPDWVDDIIVTDNGSADDTVAIAESCGVRVVHEPRRGYGAACLRGIQALSNPDIVVFLDGDYSDHPEQMDTLVDPIINDTVDMVIGSRARGNAEKGALTPQARFGNQLACFLMRLFWGVHYTDLGPFRAIRYTSLQSLGMADTNYGWTVEMQIKATLHKLRTTEVPVDYRKRIGRSKVSGTVRGVVGAGYKILSTLFISAARYHLYQKNRLNKKRRLIVFTRFPAPGETKTRLIPELGPDGAADLQRALTEHAVNTASATPNIEVEIQFTGASVQECRDWLGDDLSYREQTGDTLGDRMRNAFRSAFEDDIDHAAIIGIDCPGITSGTIHCAFEALHDTPLTLGPATDGGYYLIGMRSKTFNPLSSALFDDIPWGTEDVYTITRDRLSEYRVAVTRLAYLNDIDEPGDLPEWDRCRLAENKPSLSVIIPTLNAADTIEATLNAVDIDSDLQVIVADGGSSDTTRAIAESHNALVIPTPKGRALQMNIGAAHAAADTLLFLHADTILPPTYRNEILEGLAHPDTVAGAFRFATSDNTPTMRLIASVTNLRARWFSLPYGDQGFFLSRKTFHEAGGYDDLPIMEDFVLMQTLRRKGTIRIAPSTIITSPLRWQQRGPWRTTLLNQFIILAWYFGASPEWLAKRYKNSCTTRPSGPESTE